jgi:Gram-negative bacterial TonB protein C-terminal
MVRFAGLKSGVLGLMLVVLACVGARIVAESQAAANEFPVVDLSAGDSQLWEHKVGPDTAIHVSAEEYERLSRIGPAYVELEILVSENGRVDAVKVVGDDKFHHGEEALAIERARVFKPWMQDGAKVRVKVRDYVNLLPPEQWAEVRVPFPEQWGLDGVRVRLTRGGASARVQGMS